MPGCSRGQLQRVRHLTSPGIGDSRVHGTRFGIRLEVTQQFTQFAGALPVHHAMVKFLQNGVLAARQALDKPKLPQWLAAIEMSAVQVGHYLGQGLAVTGRGHCNALEMILVAEVLVVYPVGQVQAQWNLVQLPAKVRDSADPLDDLFLEVVKAEFGAGAGIQHHQTRSVVVDRIVLTGHEQDIFLTQLPDCRHKPFLCGRPPTAGDGIHALLSTASLH